MGLRACHGWAERRERGRGSCPDRPASIRLAVQSFCWAGLFVLLNHSHGDLRATAVSSGSVTHTEHPVDDSQKVNTELLAHVTDKETWGPGSGGVGGGRSPVRLAQSQGSTPLPVLHPNTPSEPPDNIVPQIGSHLSDTPNKQWKWRQGDPRGGNVGMSVPNTRTRQCPSRNDPTFVPENI